MSGGWEVTKLLDETQLYAPSDTAALQAQIADLKQVNAVLGAQLTDMREQRDKWQSRAERVSLAAPC